MPRIIIATIARGGWSKAEVGYAHFAAAFTRHGGNIAPMLIDQEPTPSARNRAVAVAQREIGKDGILFMVDDDMLPNFDFFGRAVDHLTSRCGAVCIGSPYCGARAAGRLVQVFDRATEGGTVRISRAEAIKRKGIELVQQVGTGWIAFNMQCFELVPVPWFFYTYTSETQDQVKETEDLVFTRRLTEAGGRVYCDWNCWSSHSKPETITKPEVGDL